LGVGGSGKNPKTTSPNHRPHDIRRPPTLGRGPPRPPLRCDGSESESSHVTLPKAIDPRVQLKVPREGPSSAPMPPERSMIDIAIHLVLLFTACVEDRTTYTVVGEAPQAAPDRARIVVEVEGGRAVSGLRTPASFVERRERTARDQALPGLSEFGQRKA